MWQVHLARTTKAETKPEYTFEAKAGILRIRVEEDGMIFMEQNLPEYLDILEFEEVTDT